MNRKLRTSLEEPVALQDAARNLLFPSRLNDESKTRISKDLSERKLQRAQKQGKLYKIKFNTYRANTVNGTGQTDESQCSSGANTFRKNAQPYHSQSGISKKICCKICQSDTRCRSWNWKSNGSKCTLNQRTETTAIRNGFHSGALL